MCRAISLAFYSARCDSSSRPRRVNTYAEADIGTPDRGMHKSG